MVLGWHAEVSLCVPVIDRLGVVQGAMQVNFKPAKVLGPAEEDIVTLYARMIASSLENETKMSPLRALEIHTLRDHIVRDCIRSLEDEHSVKEVLLKHVRQRTRAQMACLYMLHTDEPSAESPGQSKKGFNQLTRSTVIVQNSDDIEDANNVEPLTEEEIEMSHSDDGFVAAALRQGSVGNVSMTSQNSKQSSLVNHSKPRWYQLVDSTSRSRARRKSILDCYAAAERLSPGSDYPYGLPVEHMLVIPLYAGSSIVGALQIINRVADYRDMTLPKQFTESDEETMISLGSFAALVLENLRLQQSCET